MRDFDDEFDPFRMMKRIEKMFGSLDKSAGFEKFRQDVREPLVDVTETSKDIKITVELPGVDKKDIDISVKNNYLAIKAVTKRGKEEDKEDYLYKERSFQSYYRMVPLPEYADTKNINAKYNNGILEITIPKLVKKKENKNKIVVK